MTIRFDAHRRIPASELMDEVRIEPDDLARCLSDLEWLSRATLGHRPSVRWVRRAVAGLPPGSRLSVLDVACGGGDMLRAIWEAMRGRGIDLRLRGIDLNPDTIAIARALTPVGAPIEYAVGDALGFADEADLIVNALFLHHLVERQAAEFLRRVASQARRGWLVSDLHRHSLPFWGLHLGTRLVRLHRFVRHDGPVSVARGWSAAELRGLLAAAGLADRAAIRWHLPFRWTLEGRTA